MLPKSKRAKRRNRHKLSGRLLYFWFRYAEDCPRVTNVLGRDTKFRICAFFDITDITMKGGVVNGSNV